MTRKPFDIEIIQAPWPSNCDRVQKIGLATYDATGSHMNLVIRNSDPQQFVSACLQPATAIKVRDALIEAYPLPVQVITVKPKRDTDDLYLKVFGGGKQITVRQPIDTTKGVYYAKTIWLDSSAGVIDITMDRAGSFTPAVAAKLRDALTEMLGDAKPVPVTIADMKFSYPMMFSALPPAPPPPPPPVTTKAPPKGAQAYRGNGNHTWEKVVGDTQRLRVPGGWLYETDHGDATFVPVPVAVGYAV